MNTPRTLATAAIAATGLLLGTAAPSLAREAAHGHPAAMDARRQADHNHFEGRHDFEAHRDFDREHHPRAFIDVGPSFYAAPVYTYAAPPAYVYAPPEASYWYYCPAYGAYYPSVQTCPDPWVPVLSAQ